MLAHKIVGNAMQQVVCQLEPGQTVYGEPGKFLWKTPNVQFETRLSTPVGNQAGAPAAKTGFLQKAAQRRPRRHLGGTAVNRLLQPSRQERSTSMGLMDKVKQQAEQALAKAQQGVSQGQAKLDQVQAKRQADGLLRNLGAAYYAQVRRNGPPDAVTAALAALDEHAQTHGDIDTSVPAARTGGTSNVGEKGPRGDYKLEDL